MQNIPPTPLTEPLVLRPDPQWFVTRGVVIGVVLPICFGMLGLGNVFLPCLLVAVVLWLVFRNSTIALDADGFSYRSGVRSVSHRWVDVERFALVRQRMLGFITVSKYVGWDYSPSYKNYKLLAINRGLAQLTGMTHAMFKPLGFDVPSLIAVLDAHLQQSRNIAARSPLNPAA